MARNPPKLRKRPNQTCLFCDAKLTRPPSTTRAYYYCDDSCWRPCNRSVRFFNPEFPSKSRGTPVSLMATMWWVMREAKIPLSTSVIHERLIANFGDNPRLKDKTALHHVFRYFKPEVYRKIKTSKYIEYEVVQDIPFKDALKSKYLSVITKYENTVGKEKGKSL